MTTQAPPLVRPGFDDALAEMLLAVPVVGPSAERHATLAPFDGQPLFPVPYSTVQDVDLAIDTAREAQQRWAAVPLEERCQVMLRFHDLLIRYRDQGLDLIQWETGKTRMDALKELFGVCTVARHYARDAERLLSVRPMRGVVPGLTRVHVEHHPVGVVGIVTPWNYPLFLPMADGIPALVAGNAVVLKPDHQTSLIALWAVDLLHRAGVPPRALQVVLGHGPVLGPELLERVDHMAFTGSSRVGSSIAGRCGERLIGCSMELGGKNALIVCADAEPRRSSEIALRAAFDNAGQLCVGTERMYVVSSAYDAFMEQFLARISGLHAAAEVGWAGTFGSLISQGQLERVAASVEDAVAKGAEVLTGGRPMPEVGPYYYAPTVLTGVREGMTIHREEAFGPVVWVERVPDEEAAIQRTNDSEYGLNASIMVGDTRRGVSIARRLRTGSVNVNEAYEATFGSTRAPMGGMKQSGLGRRNGDHGLTRFTEEQTVAVQHGIGFGTPLGMEPKDWAATLTVAFSAMKRLGLK